MKKILSISIASYNIEKYIEGTVESLLNKEILDKLEILIISDGSTDNTVKLGKKYEEQFPDTVRVIEKKNGGWGSTVNVGIREATGKYFKLLDGDDLFVTENLPAFIEYLEKHNADLVLTPYVEFIDGTNQMKEPITHGKFATNIVTGDEINTNAIINMHECCFRTAILKENNVTITEKCFYTDVEFVIRGLSNVKTIGFLDKIIYKYRVARAEQSMSVQGFRKHYKEHLKVLYTILEFEKKYHGHEKIKELIKSRIKLVVMMQYNIFCLLEGNKAQRTEVKQFDKTLKTKYPAYYKVDIKKVKILRGSMFLLYSCLCKIYINKMEKRTIII